MKRKYWWMGIGALVLALAATAVYAKGHRGKHHHIAGPRFEALDLTQEQKHQLKSLRTENRKKMIKLKADMQLAHVELRELMSEKAPNQGKVDRTVEKMNAAHAEMTKIRVMAKLSLNKILTDEQRQKLKEMPKRRHRGGRHFRGHRRGGFGRGMGMGEVPAPTQEGDGGSQI